jgi:hypothetical protein
LHGVRLCEKLNKEISRVGLRDILDMKLPSTASEVPVMKLALSLAKNKIAFANSSADPGRPEKIDG